MEQNLRPEALLCIHLGGTLSEGVSIAWLGLDTDFGSLHWSQSNVSEELCASWGSQVQGGSPQVRILLLVTQWEKIRVVPSKSHIDLHSIYTHEKGSSDFSKIMWQLRAASWSINAQRTPLNSSHLSSVDQKHDSCPPCFGRRSQSSVKTFHSPLLAGHCRGSWTLHRNQTCRVPAWSSQWR